MHDKLSNDLRADAGTSRAGELVGIQVMRGIAASLVVLHHALEESLASTAPPTSPDWLTTLGACGVDIFFVISGFIMLHTSFPLGRPALSVKQFVVKRLSRIYPFYWFCLATTLSLWSIGFYQKLKPSISDLIDAFLLLPTQQPIIGVAWTLVYEMYFYCIFAVVLFFGSHLASTALTSGIILAVLGLSIGLAGFDAFFSNPIVLEFCFGMFLARAFRQGQIPSFVIRYGWIVGCVLLCAASLYVKHDTTNELPAHVRWFAWGIPAFLVVSSALTFSRPKTSLFTWLILLGDASYAIYLTHPFVMVAYAKLLHNARFVELPQLPIVPLVFAASMVIGCLAHKLIERPLINFVRPFSNRQWKWAS
jgi:exopolysaccharide production protein ExoZ